MVDKLLTQKHYACFKQNYLIFHNLMIKKYIVYLKSYLNRKGILMKKWISGIILFMLVGLLLACGDEENVNNSEDKETTAENEKDQQELWKEINSLKTIVSFMNTGAHPDDENSGLLAFMSLGKGVESSTVLANRGKGGQNEIGTETGEGLSVIRTRELQEASKFINNDLEILNQDFDDSITDFGFSKSPDETLEKWGEEKTYKRLIKEIRKHRPDILFTSFRDIENQHGHHRAVSILSQRAFNDAANPEVFPEQLENGLEVWQPQKFYLPANDDEGNETLRFNIGGEVDPIYNKTYPQLGEEARYFHESQGMGEDLEVEDQYESLELAESEVNNKGKEEKSIFDDIPYDFKEYADQIDDEDLKEELNNFQEELDEIVDLYPEKLKILEKTQKVLGTVDDIKAQLQDENYSLSDSMKVDLLDRLNKKDEQLQKISTISADLDIQLKPEDNQLVRGEKTEISVIIKNEGETEVSKVEVDPIVPENWDVSGVEKMDSIEAGDTVTTTFDVEVSENADYFDPYEDFVVQADVSYHLMDSKVEHTISPDAKNPIAVLPDFDLELSPEKEVVRTEEGKQEFDVDVNVTNYVDGSNEGQVEIEVPDNWSVEPKKTDVSFSKQDEKKKVSFKVETNDDVDAGDYSLNAKVVNNEGDFSETYHPIDYDHIGKTYWPKGEAEVDTKSFSLEVPDNLKVGYVDSGFDNLPDKLQRIGMDVIELTSEDLESGKLNQYDTIVIGIRGYLDRDDLKENNDQLLNYVKDGGHVVMQYHKPDDNWDTEETAPYKLEIGEPSIEWRVTDEESDVEVLKPKSPIFNWPNEINNDDWGNWEQERGLYFPMDWDEEFEPYISMSDKSDLPYEGPFEGGMLKADYGEGSYLYTNLGWYRQIDHNVPGAYRIFTNLLSYPLYEENEKE